MDVDNHETERELEETVDPGWERQVRRALDNLRQAGMFEKIDDSGLAERLRRETLVGFNRLLEAALGDGHPDFILRVLRSAGRIAGLEGPGAQINVNVGAGGSESLPSLAHLSDEELARLMPAQLVSAEQITLPSLPKRKRQKKGGDGE